MAENQKKIEEQQKKMVSTHCQNHEIQVCENAKFRFWQFFQLTKKTSSENRENAIVLRSFAFDNF